MLAVHRLAPFGLIGGEAEGCTRRLCGESSRPEPRTEGGQRQRAADADWPNACDSQSRLHKRLFEPGPLTGRQTEYTSAGGGYYGIAHAERMGI